VEPQLPSESAGGNSLSNVHLPDVRLLHVPPPSVPLPDIPLPDVLLPDAHPDVSVGEAWTSPRVAEEACVWVRVGILSCECALL
jgi:hypothetical protein